MEVKMFRICYRSDYDFMFPKHSVNLQYELSNTAMSIVMEIFGFICTLQCLISAFSTVLSRRRGGEVGKTVL